MSQDVKIFIVYGFYMLILLALILGWAKSLSYGFRSGGGRRRRKKR